MAKIWGQLERAQLENLASDPSQGVRGRVWYNSVNNDLAYDDGTIVRKILSLNNNVSLVSRDQAGAANINLIKANTSDQVELGAATVVSKVAGELLLGTEALTQNGSIRFNSVQGEYEGRVAGVTVPIGGQVAMKIVDNDAAGDGTIILKAGSRWLNGIEETNVSDITTATPSTGTDDTIRTLDGTTGLVDVVGATIRNHIYWDMSGNKFVTITNAATLDKQKYDSLTRTINTTQYAPIGFIDVAEAAGAFTFSNLTNYPIESWDSFHQIQAADGWQSWIPVFSASGSMTFTSVTTNTARFRRVGNSVEFYIRATGTTGGTASTGLTLTIPIPAFSPPGALPSSAFTSGDAQLDDGGTSLDGHWFIGQASEGQIQIQKSTLANWGLGAARSFIAHGFYEIDASNGFNPMATPATEFNSNINTLIFKSTAIVAGDPIGTFNTYAYTINTTNKIINGTAPTQSTNLMNTQGIFLTARAYNAADSSTTPSTFAVKIGTNLDPRSIEIFVYKGTNKDQPLQISSILNNTNEQGLYHSYDRSTGILWLDCGLNFSASITTRSVGSSISASTPADELTGYVEIFASATTPVVGLPQQNSKVKVETGVGHGSTNTMIRRFVTIVSSIGTSITFADSATLGSTFTINENGLYAISSGDNENTTGGRFGISLNSANLTTSIFTIPSAERLAIAQSSGGQSNSVSILTRLSVGDIIRAHTDSNMDDSTTDVWFHIEKVNF